MPLASGEDGLLGAALAVAAIQRSGRKLGAGIGLPACRRIQCEQQFDRLYVEILTSHVSGSRRYHHDIVPSVLCRDEALIDPGRAQRL